jgi:hypothetical protein
MQRMTLCTRVHVQLHDPAACSSKQQLKNMMSIHSRIITGELIACVAISHEPSLCVHGS